MKSGSEFVFIDSILRKSGELVLKSFGGKLVASRKQEKSQIVTDLDVASEKLLIASLEEEYPRASIIAEESGFVQKDTDDVWIIDPIDGTSNFANGLPWFGIMIAHFFRGEVVTSGIYLPVSNEMYFAEKGRGAYRNGKRFKVTTQHDLSLCLLAFGTDGSERSFPLRIKAKLYETLLPEVLNIRATNSAVDYAYAAQGKLGGLINLENRIWDIAPIIPIAIEAGCVVTDVLGKQIVLGIDQKTIAKNFTLLIAASTLHRKILSLATNALS